MEWTPIIVEIDAKINNIYENFKNVIMEISNVFGEDCIKSKSDINTQPNEKIFLIYVNSQLENDIKEYIDKLKYVKRSKIIDSMQFNNTEFHNSEDPLSLFFDKNKHIGVVCKNYKCKTVLAKNDNQS